MEVAPRQRAVLGGLKKAVKGVAKGISGILKSDLGKAALLGVGAFGLPAMGSFGGFKGLLSGKVPAFGLPEFLSGEKTLGKTLKVGAAGSLLGAVLGGLDEEEEKDIKEGRNIAALETKLRTAYADLGTYANDPEGLESQIKSDLSEYSKDMSRGLMSIGGRAGFSQGKDVKVKKLKLSDLSSDFRQEYLSNKKEGYEGDIEDYIREFYSDEALEGFKTGGRVGYANGMNNPEDLPKGLRKDTTTSNPVPENAPNMAAAEIAKVIMGTLGDGEDMTSRKFIFEKYVMPKRSKMMENFGIGLEEADNLIRQEMAKYRKNRADGGRMKYAMGTDQIVDQASGIMGLPQRVNQAGVKELDLRESGGFIPPVGIKEKADDIPAMLSNNEFVFTADAVRGMGNGNVNKGAQRLYDQMKKLENKVV